MRTTLTIENNEFLNFTPEILEATGWKVGDVLEWIDNNDGSFTLVKQEHA